MADEKPAVPRDCMEVCLSLTNFLMNKAGRVWVERYHYSGENGAGLAPLPFEAGELIYEASATGYDSMACRAFGRSAADAVKELAKLLVNAAREAADAREKDASRRREDAFGLRYWAESAASCLCGFDDEGKA